MSRIASIGTSLCENPFLCTILIFHYIYKLQWIWNIAGAKRNTRNRQFKSGWNQCSTIAARVSQFENAIMHYSFKFSRHPSWKNEIFIYSHNHYILPSVLLFYCLWCDINSLSTLYLFIDTYLCYHKRSKLQLHRRRPPLFILFLLVNWSFLVHQLSIFAIMNFFPWWFLQLVPSPCEWSRYPIPVCYCFCYHHHKRLTWPGLCARHCDLWQARE